jgi:G3E family GTPase
MAEAHDQRLPVMLLTGFLGSGKTTLLNSWLRSPDLADAAVIVNEFGEVGIDHALIASSNDNTIELSTGCLCCTVRGDLVDTLRELTVKRSNGEVRAFDRVIIETTGLADPAPVIQALMTFPVAMRYRLRQVVTTVDAMNGLSTLDRHVEARKQAAVADEIVVTKTDLATERDTLVARLKSLNPGARLHVSAPDRMPSASELATTDIYDPTTKSDDVLRWLNPEAYAFGADSQDPAAGDHEHGDAHGHHHHHRHDVNRHSADIGSFCLQYSEPLEWDHVANWLDALVMAHGDDLLRVKGILDIAGRDTPIVVQAVQHLFHPPTALAAWPNQKRQSQIVFITRGLSRDFVSEVFDTVRQRRLSDAPTPTSSH